MKRVTALLVFLLSSLLFSSSVASVSAQGPLEYIGITGLIIVVLLIAAFFVIAIFLVKVIVTAFVVGALVVGVLIVSGLLYFNIAGTPYIGAGPPAVVSAAPILVVLLVGISSVAVIGYFVSARGREGKTEPVTPVRHEYPRDFATGISPPMTTMRFCPYCHHLASYMPQSGSWYCRRCNRYV